MNRRGVCYDVGRVMWGQDWRPEFSPEETRRELEIIRDDLRCNAVRICGQDLGRLMTAAGSALDRGLEVWLSPELWDRGPGETLTYISEAAERVREVFRGPVTYASVSLETVEWSGFDIVSVDLYREARIKDQFAGLLDRYFGFDRPVAITDLPWEPKESFKAVADFYATSPPRKPGQPHAVPSIWWR